MGPGRQREGRSPKLCGLMPPTWNVPKLSSRLLTATMFVECIQAGSYLRVVSYLVLQCHEGSVTVPVLG